MSSIFNEKYIQITYNNVKNNYPHKLCEFLIKKYKIKKGSKILDIGCGNGEITEAFNKLGMECHGIDISENSKLLIGDDKFKKFDISKKGYPYNNEEFDIIFSKSVIEHLRDPDVLFDESYRMLKTDGKFICMCPSWRHSYKEAFYIDHTHVTPFTKFSLKTACELSGFKSKCHYFYQLPLLWKFPILNIFRKLISVLPLLYRPFDDVIWSDSVNKVIRFSKEAMLISISEKQ